MSNLIVPHQGNYVSMALVIIFLILSNHTGAKNPNIGWNIFVHKTNKLQLKSKCKCKNPTQATYKFSPLRDFSHSYLNFSTSWSTLNPASAYSLVLFHDWLSYSCSRPRLLPVQHSVRLLEAPSTLQPAANSYCGLVFVHIFNQFGSLGTSLFNTQFVESLIRLLPTYPFINYSRLLLSLWLSSRVVYLRRKNIRVIGV